MALCSVLIRLGEYVVHRLCKDVVGMGGGLGEDMVSMSGGLGNTVNEGSMGVMGMAALTGVSSRSNKRAPGGSPILA